MKASEVLVSVVERECLGNSEDWVLHEVICSNELGLSSILILVSPAF